MHGKGVNSSGSSGNPFIILFFIAVRDIFFVCVCVAVYDPLDSE